MDREETEQLIRLNRDFYERSCTGFAASRRAPWPGFRRVARRLADLAAAGKSLHILDLACGNLRFERFLEKELAGTELSFAAVDACDGFPFERVESSVDFRRADILETLLEGGIGAWDAGSFDAAVSFGFLHHIPGEALREEFLRQTVSLVRPGGVACVSLWRFADNADLAAKARESTRTALGQAGRFRLEEGDYLVGWRNEPGLYRYCHSFSERDIDRLAAVAGTVADVERFDSDGRDGRMNAYLVMTRR